MADGCTPLEELFRRLKEKGYRLTPQRRAVAAAALGNSGASTALEVLERVRPSFPDISLDTVYRNLHLLTELGFLNRINLPG
ncbi:MAG: transcriptional repressor, partial [Bacillota bacterium]|nr:transcriptional repressor [Bacillota bacterium]